MVQWTEKRGGAGTSRPPRADVPQEDIDVAQPTHRRPAALGPLSRTAGEQRRAHLEHATVTARREAFRTARTLTEDLAEHFGQLAEGAADASEALQLQESARTAVRTIVRVLAGGAPVPPVRRTSGDPEVLDEWVVLLDELLTDAQVGYDGAHGRALVLAASIAVGVDRLAGVEREGRR
jgi:hypothetical protein